MKDLLINIATGFFHTVQVISNDPVLALCIISVIVLGFITLIIKAG